MTYALVHGTTSQISDSLLCQEMDIQHKVEISKVLGMVSGKAEVVKVFPHTHENSGSVKGHGDITITPGVGSAGVTAISGGITLIEMLKYKLGVNVPSDWEYNWFNWPSAA